MTIPRDIKYVRSLDCDFWHRLEITPYRLDGRHGGHNYEPEPAKHLPALLDLRLSGKRISFPDTVLIGRESEPYPRRERRERLMRRTLETIAKHGHGVTLATRSSLFLRDIDLLREINEPASATVAVILPSLTRKTLLDWEPDTPPPAARRAAMERVKRSGIQTGIVVPMRYYFGNGALADLERLFRFASGIFLDFVLILGDGGVPVSPVAKASGGSTHRKAARDLERSALSLALHYHVPLRIRRHLPADFRRENYWLASLVANRGYLRRLRGQSFHQHRRLANRINRLDTDVRGLVNRGELQRMLDIPEEIWPEVKSLTDGEWCGDSELRLISGDRG